MHSLTMRFFCSNAFTGNPVDSVLRKVPHMAPRPPRTQLPFASLPLNLLSPHPRTYCTSRNHWRAPVRQLLSCRPGTCRLLSLAHSPPPHRSLLTFSSSRTVVTSPGRFLSFDQAGLNPPPCSHSSTPPVSRLSSRRDARPRLLPRRDSKASDFPASRGQRVQKARLLFNHLGLEVTLTSLLPIHW